MSRTVQQIDALLTAAEADRESFKKEYVALKKAGQDYDEEKALYEDAKDEVIGLRNEK